MAVRREVNLVGRVDREDTAPAPTAAGGHFAPGVHDRFSGDGNPVESIRLIRSKADGNQNDPSALIGPW